MVCAWDHRAKQLEGQQWCLVNGFTGRRCCFWFSGWKSGGLFALVAVQGWKIPAAHLWHCSGCLGGRNQKSPCTFGRVVTWVVQLLVQVALDVSTLLLVCVGWLVFRWPFILRRVPGRDINTGPLCLSHCSSWSSRAWSYGRYSAAFMVVDGIGGRGHAHGWPRHWQDMAARGGFMDSAGSQSMLMGGAGGQNMVLEGVGGGHMLLAGLGGC